MVEPLSLGGTQRRRRAVGVRVTTMTGAGWAGTAHTATPAAAANTGVKERR